MRTTGQALNSLESVRLRTPSLERMLLRWNFTVERLATRRAAMSGLLSPSTFSS